VSGPGRKTFPGLGCSPQTNSHRRIPPSPAPTSIPEQGSETIPSTRSRRPFPPAAQECRPHKILHIAADDPVPSEHGPGSSPCSLGIGLAAQPCQPQPFAGRPDPQTPPRPIQLSPAANGQGSKQQRLGRSEAASEPGIPGAQPRPPLSAHQQHGDQATGGPVRRPRLITCPGSARLGAKRAIHSPSPEPRCSQPAGRRSSRSRQQATATASQGAGPRVRDRSVVLSQLKSSAALAELPQSGAGNHAGGLRYRRFAGLAFGHEILREGAVLDINKNARISALVLRRDSGRGHSHSRRIRRCWRSNRACAVRPPLTIRFNDPA